MYYVPIPVRLLKGCFFIINLMKFNCYLFCTIISLILLLCSCSSEKTDSEALAGFDATRSEEERGAASDSSASCEDHLVAGEPLGIVAVPAEFQDTYGKLFCVSRQEKWQENRGRDDLG